MFALCVLVQLVLIVHIPIKRKQILKWHVPFISNKLSSPYKLTDLWENEISAMSQLFPTNPFPVSTRKTKKPFPSASRRINNIALMVIFSSIISCTYQKNTIMNGWRYRLKERMKDRLCGLNFLQPPIQVCRGAYIPYFKINAPIFCCPNKMVNKHTVDYHPSASQLFSSIHPFIFL